MQRPLAKHAMATGQDNQKPPVIFGDEECSDQSPERQAAQVRAGDPSNLYFAEAELVDPRRTDDRHADQYRIARQRHVERQRYRPPTVENGAVMVQGALRVSHRPPPSFLLLFAAHRRVASKQVVRATSKRL